MRRRRFLTSSLAVSALGLGGAAFPSKGATQTLPSRFKREYYLLRRYQLIWGPQVKHAHKFFEKALVPALNRLGIKPVGVFNCIIGPYTPRIFILMPSPVLETLTSLYERLLQDSEYLKEGAAFLNAAAVQPSYFRVKSTLLCALKGWPKLVLPIETAHKEPRLFELRTYQNPTDQAHVRKQEMINTGYYPIFKEAGFGQVFYGTTLVGSHMPNLTYMLSFGDMTERDKYWKAFFASPAWKRLSTKPRFSFEGIVSKVSNIILSPAKYSQI